MMRENDRIKSPNERQIPLSTTSTINSNVPLMAMTPMTTTNSSSSLYKDLTSSLFEQNPPQPSYGMSTSQTMPTFIRPTVPSTIQRPRQNFPSSSNPMNLTSSLMNNINSLSSRPQTAPTTIPLNSMNANSNPSYFNSGTTSGDGLFQPPPGSTAVKTAAAELDDLFN
jgi:hypothetical protein